MEYGKLGVDIPIGVVYLLCDPKKAEFCATILENALSFEKIVHSEILKRCPEAKALKRIRIVPYNPFMIDFAKLQNPPQAYTYFIKSMYPHLPTFVYRCPHVHNVKMRDNEVAKVLSLDDRDYVAGHLGSFYTVGLKSENFETIAEVLGRKMAEDFVKESGITKHDSIALSRYSGVNVKEAKQNLLNMMWNGEADLYDLEDREPNDKAFFDLIDEATITKSYPKGFKSLFEDWLQYYNSSKNRPCKMGGDIQRMFENFIKDNRRLLAAIDKVSTVNNSAKVDTSTVAGPIPDLLKETPVKSNIKWEDDLLLCHNDLRVTPIADALKEKHHMSRLFFSEKNQNFDMPSLTEPSNYNSSYDLITVCSDTICHIFCDMMQARMNNGFHFSLAQVVAEWNYFAYVLSMIRTFPEIIERTGKPSKEESHIVEKNINYCFGDYRVNELMKADYLTEDHSAELEKLRKEIEKLQEELEECSTQDNINEDGNITCGPYHIVQNKKTAFMSVIWTLKELNFFMKEDGQFATNRHDVIQSLIEGKANSDQLIGKALKGDSFMNIFHDLTDKAAELYGEK